MRSISLCKNKITSFFLANVYFLINPLLIECLLILFCVIISSISFNYLFFGNNEFKLSKVFARLCAVLVKEPPPTPAFNFWKVPPMVSVSYNYKSYRLKKDDYVLPFKNDVLKFFEIQVFSKLYYSLLVSINSFIIYSLSLF